MKTIIALVFLFFYSLATFAVDVAYKGDTVKYKFDTMLIEVISTNALQTGLRDVQLQEHVVQVQNVLAEMNIVPPLADERIIISLKQQGSGWVISNYKEVELLRQKQRSKSLVVFDDGTTFENDYGRYCFYFQFNAHETKVYVENLEDLDYISSEMFAAKADSASAYLAGEYGKRERKRIHGWLDLRDETVKAHFSNINNQNMDQIEISGGIGSGWIKNTFVSDINVRLGLMFGKKGAYKNKYSIDWNMMYDFSGSNENKFFELNHFVSLAWETNFSNSPDESQWYGLSVGYLVKRNNDFFKKNTFKVGVNKKINDTFIIKPELYFNDFLKNVYPGIRLSVAF